MVTLESLMKRMPAVVREGDSLGLARAIAERLHLSHVPVVRGRSVVGLLTPTELTLRADGTGEASRFMHRDFNWGQPNDSISNTEAWLGPAGEGYMLVLDVDHRLLGMVTPEDLHRHAESDAATD